MDNLVSQGTGATRLNFAQKAIATGMSVILAFGLSPLGQVPAYAQGPDTVAAQSVLKPQADQIGSINFVLTTGDKSTTYTANGAAQPVYNGEDVKLSSVVVGTTKDDVLANVNKFEDGVGVYQTGEKGSEVTQLTVTVTEAASGAAAPTDELVPGVEYKVDVTPSADGSLAMLRAQSFTFTVAKFNLEAEGVTIDAELAKAINYTGDDQAVAFDSVVATATGLLGGKDTLEAGTDYEIDASTEMVRGAGEQDVVINGLGGYTGSKTVKVKVGPSAFGPTVSSVSGVEVNNDGTMNDLPGQAYGSVEDPVGAVVAGKDTLVRGEDYTVEYYDGNANNSKVVEEYKKDPGTYKVVIKANPASNKWTKTGVTEITTKYAVSNTGKYITDDAAAATAANDTYAYGQPVKATDITFKDKSGATVSIPAGDYTIAYGPWTAALEKDLLGSQYYAVWGTDGYDEELNTAKIGKFVDKDGKAVDSVTDATKAFPANAGDYAIYLIGGADYASDELNDTTVEKIAAGEHTLVAKFTVDPIDAKVGEANGNLVVPLPEEPEVEYGTAVDPIDDAAIQYVKDATAKKSLRNVAVPDKAVIKYFKSGTDRKVEANEVTIEKGSVLNVGSYDAVITFGNEVEISKGEEKIKVAVSNFKEPIVIENVFKVDPFDISATDVALKGIVLDGTADKDGFVPVDYAIVGQKPAIKSLTAAEAYTKEGAVLDNTEGKGLLQAKIDDEDTTNLDTFKLVYGPIDEGGYDSEGNPNLVGKYEIVGIEGAGNYTGKVSFTQDNKAKYQIKQAKVLDGTSVRKVIDGATVAAQIYDPDTEAWVTSSGGAAETSPVYSIPWDDAYKAEDGKGATIAKENVRVVVLDEDGKLVMDGDNPVTLPAADFDIAYEKEGKATNKEEGVVEMLLTETGKANTVKGTSPLSAYFFAAGKSFKGEGIALAKESETVEYTSAQQLPAVEVKTKAGTVLNPEYYTVTVLDEDDQVVAKTGTDGKLAAERVKDGETPLLTLPGTYTVRVTGAIGKNSLPAYAGILSSTFTIAPREAKAADVVNPKYDADKKAFETTVKSNDLKAGLYVLVNPITYSANAKAENNVAINSVFWTDSKIEKPIELVDATKMSDAEIDAAVKKDSSYSYYKVEGDAAHTDAGDYSAKLTFGGCFSGSVDQAYKINPIDISAKTKDGDPIYAIFLDGKMGLNTEFTGFEVEPTITVCDIETKEYDGKDSSKAIEILGNDYNFSTKVFANNVNAGSNASVTVAPEGNYTGVLAAHFNITPADLSKVEVAYTDDELAATGKAIEPKGALTYKTDKGTYPLVEGTDYVIDKYTGKRTAVGDSGVASYVGIGNFLGSKKDQTFEVKEVKAEPTPVDPTPVNPTPTDPTVGPTTPTTPTVVTAANPITVKAKTAKVKYSKVKKKKQTLAVSKVLTVKNAQGKLTYTKKSGNKKITINKTTGKVTVKKGLKKGTYKVKVAVKAAGKTVGTTNYTAKTVTKTFKVKVK